MTAEAQTPSEIDISILMVSYNTRAMTAAAVSSAVAATRKASYEIIAVDNASEDGSAAMLSAHPSRPHTIALPKNVGFSAGNNIAAGIARGRYLLLLNPDTIVNDGAIDALLAFAQANPAARIWGGRTLFGDGSLNPSSCWSRMTPWNLLCRATGLTAIFPKSEFFNGEAFGGWQRDSIRQVDIVSGCFLLIERELWQQLGGFDPAFFMYGEEADLCLRARALGAKPMVTPTATIVHYGGASERTRAGKMVRLLAAKASLIRRHWQSHLVPLGLALNAAWPLSRAIATGIIARLSGDAARKHSADAWREIWQRRSEWRRGYAALPANRPTPRVVRAPNAPSKPLYSIATLVTKPAECDAMRASFASGGFDESACEFLHIDNTGPQQTDAFRGLNAMLAAARAPRVILCHQDVRLLQDNRAALDARLADLTERDPAWAIAGNAGGVAPGRLAIRITDPHGRDQHVGALPARVMSLDENFLVVRRDAGVGFSDDLTGFHFYGADICLNAEVKGQRAYVIDFHLEHLSPGKKDASFTAAERAFVAKWSRVVSPRWMQTTCTLVHLTDDPVRRSLGRLIDAPIAKITRRLAALRPQKLPA